MSKNLIKWFFTFVLIMLLVWGYSFFGKAIYIEIIQPNEKSDLTQVVIDEDTEYVFYKGTPLVRTQVADEYDVVYQLKSDEKMTEEYVLDKEFYNNFVVQHFFENKELISDEYTSVFTYNPETEELRRKDYFEYDKDAEEGTIQDGGADGVCGTCEEIITTSTKTISDTEKELSICKMESDECKKRIVDSNRTYRGILETNGYYVVKYEKEVQSDDVYVFELYDEELNYISELELNESKLGVLVDGRTILIPSRNEESKNIEELVIEDGKMTTIPFTNKVDVKYLQTLPFRENQPLAVINNHKSGGYGVLSIENEELVFEDLQPEEYKYGFEVSHQLPDGTFLCTLSSWGGGNNQYKKLEKIIEYDFEKREVVKEINVEEYDLRNITLVDKIEKNIKE